MILFLLHLHSCSMEKGRLLRTFCSTLQLQSWEKTVDCHSPGQGLMPASFKVRSVPLDGRSGESEDVLDPDFGESAIGRVAPGDSGLWWIILLRAYGKLTGDYTLQERWMFKLCFADGFDMFPSLLVTDGSCMIGRRMRIHGHPLEIQDHILQAMNDLILMEQMFQIPAFVASMYRGPHFEASLCAELYRRSGRHDADVNGDDDDNDDDDTGCS